MTMIAASTTRRTKRSRVSTTGLSSPPAIARGDLARARPNRAVDEEGGHERDDSVTTAVTSSL